MELIHWNTAWRARFRPLSPGLACLALSLVFAAAGLAKLQRLDDFESTLIASHLVPVVFARLAASGVIALELVLAASLCISRLRPAALQTAQLLVCGFIAYTAWRWWRNIPVPCHCFGVLFTMAPWQALLLDLGLLGVVTQLLISSDVPAPRDASRDAPGNAPAH